MASSDETGAAAIEYALLLAAVAGVIALVAYTLGLRTVQGMQTVLDLWP